MSSLRWKRGHVWLFFWYIGGWNTTQLCGDYNETLNKDPHKSSSIMDCMLCVHSNKLVCNKKGSGTKKKPIEKTPWRTLDGGLYVYTLPETTSEFAPENWWLEDDPACFWVPTYFQVRTVSFRECIYIYYIYIQSFLGSWWRLILVNLFNHLDLEETL